MGWLISLFFGAFFVGYEIQQALMWFEALSGTVSSGGLSPSRSQMSCECCLWVYLFLRLSWESRYSDFNRN